MRKSEVSGQQSAVSSQHSETVIRRRCGASRQRKIVSRFLSAAFCLLLTAHCLLLTATAQSTGGVKGKVRNMRGELVADATVTARRDSTDIKSATSNGKGEFVLRGLDSGIYNIVVDAKGYSTGIKYNVEIKQNKTVDLGERLILQIDKGTQVIVQGSVFYKGGTSITGAEVRVEKINADGSVKKIGTVMTNIYGEFSFRQPEGTAKFRLTVKFKDATATQELDVDNAAIYRLSFILPIERK